VYSDNEVLTLANAFEVAPKPARLTGRVIVRGLDEDRDGHIDLVAYDIEIEVLQPDTYSAELSLGSEKNHDTVYIYRSNRLPTLQQGHHWITASERPDGLRKQAIPLDMIRKVILHREEGSVDYVTDVKVDSRVRVEDFSLPQFVLREGLADQAIDDNGDGLFDRLQVKVPLFAEHVIPGKKYQCRVALITESGQELQQAWLFRSFEEGVNELVVDFDGQTIRAAGHNGPFRIGGLNVLVMGATLASENTSTTKPYQAAEFQQPQPRLTGVWKALWRTGEETEVDLAGRFLTFLTGPLTVSAGPGVTVREAAVLNDEKVRIVVFVEAGLPRGLRDVVVRAGDQSLTLKGRVVIGSE
jgi:hypothetical protein